MPHFVVDCSQSILQMVEPNDLMQAIYSTAESTGLFAKSGVGGIKVRLNPYSHFLNVDGQEHFVHVFANIMQGRTEEQKADLSKRIVSCLRELLATVDIISINIRDFEKNTYCNLPRLDE